MIIKKTTPVQGSQYPHPHHWDSQSAGTSSRRTSYSTVYGDEKPLPAQPQSEHQPAPQDQHSMSRRPSSSQHEEDRPPAYISIPGPSRDVPTLVVPYQQQQQQHQSHANARRTQARHSLTMPYNPYEHSDAGSSSPRLTSPGSTGGGLSPYSPYQHSEAGTSRTQLSISPTLAVPYQHSDAGSSTSQLSQFSARTASSNAGGNALSFKTNDQPISGTFHIDPAINVQPLTEESRKRKKARWPWGNTDALAVEDAQPNAKFSTRQGDIAINLAITGGGTPSSQPLRAVVDVSTRQGQITLNIYQIDQGRHLNLKVESRQGDIHLFLPRSFCGPVHLQNKKGTVTFLPNVKAAARVLRAAEYDAMVVLGEAALNPTPFGIAGDYMSICTQTGDIVLGYYEEDILPEKQSMWQRMTGWMGGSSGKKIEGA